MSAYDRYTTIRVEVDGHVAIVTLNRPERLNAVSWTMHAELATLFPDLTADDAVDAVLLTGAGGNDAVARGGAHARGLR